MSVGCKKGSFIQAPQTTDVESPLVNLLLMLWYLTGVGLWMKRKPEDKDR